MFKIVYKAKDKFNDTSDNFNFKVIIFYNKFKQIGLPSNTYIYGIFIILFSQDQIYYYVNYGNIFIFDQFYTNMQLFF